MIALVIAVLLWFVKFIFMLAIKIIVFPEIALLVAMAGSAALPYIQEIDSPLSPIFMIAGVLVLIKVTFSLLGLINIWIESKSKFIAQLISGLMAVISALSCIHIFNEFFLSTFSLWIYMDEMLILVSKTNNTINIIVSVIFYIVATIFFYNVRRNIFHIFLNENTLIIGPLIGRLQNKITDRELEITIDEDDYNFYHS